MKVSYCTTCGNRLWQLKQTLPENVKYLIPGEVELCILAYNDPTVERYLREHYSEYLKDGRIKVRSHYEKRIFADGSNWSCGPIKNLSHEMGSGEILFNLDADNFIDNSLEYLVNLKENEIAHNPPTLGIGHLGRIGVYRSLFDKVGGYRDVGRADDGDFIGRCLNTGARLVKLRCSVPPIDNNP